jgi:hypothetical protein
MCNRSSIIVLSGGELSLHSSYLILTFVVSLYRVLLGAAIKRPLECSPTMRLLIDLSADGTL